MMKKKRMKMKMILHPQSKDSKNGYSKCCSYIFLMGAHIWILLRFLALVCTVFSETEWKLQNKLIQSWNWKLFITEQSDMQTQSKVLFFINYNQGKEQSPWRFGKVNIKFVFSILGYSVSSLCLHHIFTRWGRKSQFLCCLLDVLPLKNKKKGGGGERGEEGAHGCAKKAI